METYVIEWEDNLLEDQGEELCVYIEAESSEEACHKHRKIFEYPTAMNRAWDTDYSKADTLRLKFDVINTDQYIRTRVGWEEYKKAEGEYFYLSALSEEETTERFNPIRKDEATEFVALDFDS